MVWRELGTDSMSVSKTNYTAFSVKTAITSGGCGYVEIRDVSSLDSSCLFWKLMPKKNNPPLVLATMISDRLLVTVDEKARIGVYDILAKKEVVSKELHSKEPAGACLTKGLNQLLVALYPENTRHKLVLTIDIDLLEIRNEIRLSDKALLNHLAVLNDEELVVYFAPGGGFGKEARDGLHKISFKQNLIQSYYFSRFPTGNFSTPPIEFRAEKNTGIRPCFDRIEIKTCPDGKKRYYCKVQVFDPKNCKEVRKITVREFFPEHVFEDNDPTVALSYLELPAASDDYVDARDEFMERIDALAFCHTEDTFWVGFQHGLIRKISIDGTYKSPFIAHPGDPRYQKDDPYYRTGFDTPVSISENDRYVTFGKPEITIDLEKLDLNSEQSIIVLKSGDLVAPPKPFGAEAEKEFSWNTIEMVDFEQSESFEKALGEVVRLSGDIDNARDGGLLRFRFTCHEESLSEKEFFHTLSKYPEQVINLRKFINNISEYETPLWYDEITPAGIFALRTLSLSDRQYVKDVCHYISKAVDSAVEYEEPGKLIDDLIIQYGWNKETIDLILTRATFQAEKGLDQLQQYMSIDEFKNYLEIPANLNYFRSHNLFQSLAEDYFRILMPLEDSLFEAIEAENAVMVQEIIEKGADIEVKHPDFEISPLGLAFELENREIINLLIKGGAEVDNLDLDDFIKIVLRRDTSLSQEEKRLIANTLDRLQRKREVIQDAISKIEYNHILSFSIGEKQVESLETLNKELEGTNIEIRFAKLGLNRTGDKPLEVSSEKGFDSKNSFISDTSYFEEDLKAATIIVEDLNEKESQAEAIDQLIFLSNNVRDIIVNQRLRFSFKDMNRTVDEKTFFEIVRLDDFLAGKLAGFIQNIIDQVSNELWYNDEVQACMYAVQSLVLFDKKYINLFIDYLKSDLINGDHEKLFPTELVFDCVEQYGWSNETLELIAARTISCKSACGIDEFRIQLKKGGLKEYLQDEERLEYFYQCLLKETDQEDNETVKTIHKMAMDSYSQ